MVIIMQQITVAAKSRTYDIHIGSGTVSALPEIIASIGARKVVLVSDTNVAPLYAPRILDILGDTPVTVCVIPAGESNKTLVTVERLYHEFADAEMNRRCVVVALGGGVTGDIAGFAAATFMRGMQVIQVPTTIVAQVDSSVGGKTGVNLGEGKNLVGTFYQPTAVLADTDFLTTLPRREFRAGLAEAAKCYALGEEAILPLLSSRPPSEDIEKLIALCCRLKAKYVAHDEQDTGARAALNFGHTFAHAIEKRFDYKRYNHGEAVAIGIKLALDVGVKLGVTSAEAQDKVIRAVDIACPQEPLDFPARELIPLMASDKKNKSANISLVLLREVGKPVLREINPQKLEELL